MAYKALVIDDDKVTLELLTFQLQSEGFETVAAEDGEDGLRHIRETDFDIILTDLNLPDISGIDMVRRAAGKKKPRPLRLSIVKAFGQLASPEFVVLMRVRRLQEESDTFW